MTAPLPADHGVLDVSVVVPTYNRAAMLPDTLATIFGQTVSPAEVIVVDDGSTDDTQAVLQRHVPPVRSALIPNGGDLAARNHGLRLATSRLVAFCDSDDHWLPGFLEAMLGLWRAEPRLLAAYGNFRVVQGDTVAATTKFDDAPAGFWASARSVGPSSSVFEEPIVRRLLDFQPFFPSAMMVDRVAFAALGGWDESVSRIVGTDFATSLRVAEHPPIGVLHDALVAVRKHAGNYSANVRAMNLGDAEILDRVLAARPSLQPLSGAVRDSAARRRREALAAAFDDRDFAAVTAIARLIPPDRLSAIDRAKCAVASLPGPIARAAAGTLGLAGSLRARPR